MERLGNIIADQVGSYFSFDEKMETLKRKCETLHSREVDVNTELEYAESSCGNKRRKAVENWLTNVGNLRNQVDIIDAAVARSGLFERVQLASQVENLTEQAEEFLEQGKFPQGLTLNTHHIGGLELLTKPLVGQAFQENLEKIWGYLMEPEISTIGIWGMGGVGKTTLVTHINNRALHGSFSDVCWVTVSQNLDIHKLQDRLADAIRLTLNEQDERQRAARLSSELQKKRYLFILDDVWHHIDFSRVGIPVKVNGCKAIITTRSLDVCRRIDCQQEIKVEPLSQGEAWDLFQKNLGPEVDALSKEVSKVASLVARECAGLPLGIITVARCMRGANDAREWRHALKALRESKDGLVEMEEEVFQVLMFSYNRLRDPKMQQSFLYCTLYPEDYKIEREPLVQRLIDEGIIEAMGSRQDQFDSGHTILNELVRSSLLEETYQLHGNKECVKMHDLLRDMAINMKSTEFMVNSGMQLEELPGEHEWPEDLEKISLMNNKIKEVAVATGTSPRCPKLSTLLLSGNQSLNRIENSFFQHMSALQILDLTDCVSIQELPNSVSNLKNLTALVLQGCSQLRKLPSMAELELMKRLDLYGTVITEVPHGLERLVRLTYLDLHSQHLEVFPIGILSQLLQLEFLKFCCSGRKVVKIKGEELKLLERLSTFEGDVIFDDVNGFKSYVMSRRTHRGPNCSYHFALSDRGKSVSEGYNHDNNLNRVRVTGFNVSKRAVQGIMDVETVEALLKDVQSLELWSCYGARNLCDVSWLDNGTHDLKQCHLCYCDSVQCLVPRGISFPYFLQNLEKLSLKLLCNLEFLFELGRGENGVPSSSIPPLPPPPPAEGAFSCLKVLHLSTCRKIKILFHPSFLPNLRSLREIAVHECKALQEIVEETTTEGETSTSIEYEYALPNLTTLSLIRLPNLKSICARTISCPSLCEIIVVFCPQLKRMPLFVPPSLRSIKIRPKKWWESVEWDDPNTKELLQPNLFRG